MASASIHGGNKHSCLLAAEERRVSLGGRPEDATSEDMAEGDERRDTEDSSRIDGLGEVRCVEGRRGVTECGGA